MKQKSIFLLLCCVTLIFAFLNGTLLAQKGKGRKYYEARGEIVWEVPTAKRMIALTFDDGPDARYTPQIASLLKEYDAKATFFVVGTRVQKNPEIIRQLLKDGNELANHTYSHPDLRKISEQRLKEEVTKTQETIYAATGFTPKLFRPPGGYYSESLIRVVKDAGFQVIMWSWHQDTRDWSDPGVKKIVKKVLKNARNGDIVLFHDYGGARSQTVRALKEILPELHRRGFHFVTVSELLMYQKKVNAVGKE
ncbi:MAG: polysaccharide deacetylase family protein [Clostridia bacterium]